mgnify:CR=1 FL=1
MYYHPKFETYKNAIIGVILKWLVILRPEKKHNSITIHLASLQH